jgi:hypothetical protein
MAKSETPEKRDRDEPVSLAPLDPEEALRGLLAVKPDGPPEVEDAARQEAEYPADESDEG